MIFADGSKVFVALFFYISTWAFWRIVYQLELAGWLPWQFAHWATIWIHSFFSLLLYLLTPYWLLANWMCFYAYYTFFSSISIATLMFITNFATFYIYWSQPSFSVFFYFLMASPKQKLLANSCFASILLLIVITITDFLLFSFSYYFLRQSSLISQYSIIFNLISVEDSTPFFRSSSFPNPRYLSNNIP